MIGHSGNIRSGSEQHPLADRLLTARMGELTDYTPISY